MKRAFTVPRFRSRFGGYAPGVGGTLTLTTQPSTTGASGTSLAQQPVVTLSEARAGVTVTATLSSGTGTLASDTAVSNSSGVATFSGLKITGADGAYRLQFSAPSWTSVTATADTTLSSSPAAVALSGTITATVVSDIVAGGKTIILTVANDTWVASGATFNAQRQNIINGIDSAQAEGTGWDAVVKAGLAVTAVVRTSNTVVTITLPAFASYSITADETITATIPATALTGGVQVVAAPTFSVSTFLTPSILANASFESAFDGFQGYFASPPSSTPTGLTRATDQSYVGSYALKHSWTTGTSDDSSHCEFDLGSDLTHLWARTYFRLTAEPACGGFKFFRFYRGPVNGRDYVGVQVLNGRFVWVSERANSGNGAIIYANSLPSFNAWHFLEFEYDQVNKLARMWVDETLQTYSFWYDPGNVFSASYGTQLLQWTHTDNVARYGDICQTINGSPGFPRSNSGSVWFDRIAYSTAGRIGP